MLAVNADLDVTRDAIGNFLMPGISADKAMKWLWKVRTWLLNGSVSASWSIPTHVPPLSGSIGVACTDCPLTFRDFGGTPAISESQIVDPVIQIDFGRSQGAGGCSVPPAEADAHCAFTPTAINCTFVPGSAHITVNVSIPGLIFGTELQRRNQILLYWDEDDTDDVPVATPAMPVIQWQVILTGVWTYTDMGGTHFDTHGVALGPTYDIPNTAQHAIMDGESAGLSWTGGDSISDWVLTPSKYWTYSTKAGLPVYDENTGAQLRDPFS